MNQKKCPKCGENNPAEAVMCWACYTPLTGSAIAAGGAVAPGGLSGAATIPGGLPPDSPATGKTMEPWQMGVIALGLLLAGYLAFSMLRPAEEVPVVVPTGSMTADTLPGADTKPNSTAPAASVSVAPPPPPPPPPPEGVEYTIIAPPNAEQSWATMGILLSEGTDIRRAATAAATAGQQAMTGGKWGGIHVFVFTDRNAASAFRGYQRGRNGAPVNLAAIPAKLGIGPKVLLRYELTRDGKQKLSLSSGNSS